MEAAEPTPTGCHVVHIGYGGSDDTTTAVCPGLAPEVLQEIAHAVGHRSRDLRTVVASHRLPGIALVWNQNPFAPPAQAWQAA